MEARARPKRSLARRAIAGTLALLATLVTFVGALVLGVVLHLDMAATRRLVVSEITSALAHEVKGTIRIESVERLGLTSIVGVRARITDPEGTDVLVVEGARVRYALLDILKSLVLGKGPIAVSIADLTVDRVELNLDADETGVPRLARALEARNPSGATPGAPPGRAVKLGLASVLVRQLRVHGKLSGLPAIAIDVDDFGGALDVAPEGTSIAVRRVAVATHDMPRGANLLGNLEAHITLPSRTGRAFELEIQFGGTVGGIPASARVTLDGDQLDVAVDVPQVAAADVRALVPEAPLRAPVAASIQIAGALPLLSANAHVTVGSGVFDAFAWVDLGDVTTSLVAIDAKAIDLRAFFPSAPPSVLGASARAAIVARPDGMIGGRLSITAVPGTLGTNVVPAATFLVDIATKNPAGPGAGLFARGTGSVAESGSPTDVAFRLRPSWILDVDLRSTIPRLDGIARIGPIARGQGTIAGHATLRLEQALLDATVTADVRNVARDGQRLAHGHIVAHATGPFAMPLVDASMAFEGLEVVGVKFSRGRIAAHGAVLAPNVELELEGVRAPNVRASAAIETGPVTTVRNARVTLTRGEVAARIGVDAVRIAGGDVRVDGAVIEGAGAVVHATVHRTPSALTVRADSNGLELSRLAYLAGLDAYVRGGQLAFDVDLAATRSVATGRVAVDLVGGSFFGLKDASGHLDATMHGRKISATAHAALADVGRADFTTSGIAIAGNAPLSFDSWRKAWGTVDVAAQVDLAKLAALFPKDKLPFGEIAGTLVLRGKTMRDSDADDTPQFALSAQTRGLVLAGRAPAATPQGVRAAAWRTSGVDVQLEANVDGDTGSGTLAVQLMDSIGPMLSVSAECAAIPFGAIAAAPGDAVARLEKLPFTAKLLVPRRTLQTLPKWLRPPGTEGDVEATATLKGSVLDPRLEFTAKAYALKSALSPVDFALGADVAGRYDGRALDVDVRLRSPRAEVTTGSVHVVANVADAIAAGAGVSMPWEASARAELTRFPLGAVGALADRGVRGHASGEIVVDRLHADARARIDLKSVDLQLGDVKLGSSRVDLALDDRSLKGAVRLAQADGFMEAFGSVALTWGKELVPTFDARQIDASLKASHFGVGALLPFVEGAFTQLDGRIDADVRAQINWDERQATTQGTVTLTEGRFELAALGQEFHGTKAKLVLTPDGTLRLDDLVAYGVTGKLSAHGVAHLRGLAFGDADAVVTIQKGQAIPMDVQGSQMGEVYGDFRMHAEASRDQREISVRVDVPTMHVDLPVTGTHDVQSLDEAEFTHVGVFGPGGQFVPLGNQSAATATPNVRSVTAPAVTIVVRFGQDVQVRRGADLKVTLTGEPTFRITDKPHASGKIYLINGDLVVQGKRFAIEKGTVAFVDDPTNPQVVLTAGWQAADGTHVYADFVGPLKTGRVTLRSEPSRSQSEILSLILFGTADGSASTPYASQGAAGGTAGSVASGAGGLATQGLTQGLDKLTGLEVQAKIDTTNSAAPRPEVEWQIARDISVQIGFVLGNPPPGTNPDRTLVTIGWRIMSKLSLEATFGDQGSSIADMIWQHRY